MMSKATFLEGQGGVVQDLRGRARSGGSRAASVEYVLNVEMSSGCGCGNH